MAEAAFDHPPLRDVFDFLDWVHGRERRYEFVDGRIVAMARVSRAHNDLQVNLISALHSQLRGGPCKVNGLDLLLRTDQRSGRRGRFPDATIECDPAGHPQLSDSPVVVFEILSPESERTDRGAKLREYQALLSVQHYVLVAQDALRVECFSRQDESAWLYRRPEGPEAILALDPLGVSLPLHEIYERVELAQPDPDPDQENSLG